MLPNNFVCVQNLREMGFHMQKNCKQIDYFMEKISEEKITNKNFFETSCKLPGYPRSTFLMVYSRDGSKVASTHGDHNIYVSDIKTGKCVSKLQGHPRTPWCIAFHPASNEILASGCLAGQVRVWDLHGGSEIWMTDKQNAITSLTFHPSDHVLVIATGNELYFWDWSKSKPFASCSTKNTKEKIRYVKFDALGHKLVTGIANSRVPVNSSEQTEAPHELYEIFHRPEMEEEIDSSSGSHSQHPSSSNPSTTSREDQSTQTANDGSQARSRQTRYFLRDLPTSSTEQERALHRQLQDLNLQNRCDGTLTFSVRYRSRFRLTPPPSRLFEPYRLSFRQPTPRRSRYVILRNSSNLRNRNSSDSRNVSLESDNLLYFIRNMRDREHLRSRITSHSVNERRDQQEIQRIHLLLRRLRIQIHNLQTSVSNINRFSDADDENAEERPHLMDISSQARRDNLERLLVTAETAVSLAMESYEELNREALRINDPPTPSQSNAPVSSTTQNTNSTDSSPGCSRLIFSRSGSNPQGLRISMSSNVSSTSQSSAQAPDSLDMDAASSSSSSQSNRERLIDYQIIDNLLETWQRRLQLCEIRARAFQRRESHRRRVEWLEQEGREAISNEVEERPISRLPNPFAEPTNISFQSEVSNRDADQPTLSPQPVLPPHFDHSDYIAESWPPHSSMQPRPIPVIQIENVFGQRSTVDPNLNFDETVNNSPDDPVDIISSSMSNLTDDDSQRDSLSPTAESVMRLLHRPPLVRQSAFNFRNMGFPSSEHPLRRWLDYEDPIVSRSNSYVDDEEELERWTFYRNLENNRFERPIIREYSSMFGGNTAFNPTHRIQVWDFSSCCIPNISNTTANVLVPECKIYNDASVDISNDGKLLATFVAGSLPSNTKLGVYSMEKSSFGQCLYFWNCGPNAVSVSISPQANYVIIGLSNRKISPAEKLVVAKIFKLEPGSKQLKLTSLEHVRNIEQLGGSLNRISLNCIKWLPTSGQGIIYATNRGQLQLLT